MNLESRKNGETLKKFVLLYPKFVAGGKWLDERKAKGFDVSKDTADFLANVLVPLDQLYRFFRPEEKIEADHLIFLCDKVGCKSIRFKEKMALRVNGRIVES